jgi:tetratricopeptide (TPR) repeat protein
MASTDQVPKEKQNENQKGDNTRRLNELTSIEIGALNSLIEELKAQQFLQLSEGTTDQYTITGKLGKATERSHTKEENNFLNRYETFRNIVFVYANLYSMFSGDTFPNVDLSDYSGFERNMRSIIDSAQIKEVFNSEGLKPDENNWRQIRIGMTGNTGNYTREYLEENIKTLRTTNIQILRNFFLLIKAIIRYKYRESGLSIGELTIENLRNRNKENTTRLSREIAHIPNLLIRPNKEKGMIRELFITENIPIELSDELMTLTEDYSGFNVLILNIRTDDPIQDYEKFLSAAAKTEEQNKTGKYYTLWSAAWLKMEIPTAHRSFQDAIVCTLSWIDSYELISKLQEGNSLINHGKYNEAVEFYDKMIQESDPTYRYLGLVGKVVVTYRMGKYDEALSYCNSALEINSESPSVWNNKGLVLYKMSKYNEAIECFNRALALDPSDTFAYNNNARSLLQLGSYKEAEDNVNKALSEDRESADAWNVKGNILLQERRYEDAIPNYDRAIDLNPRFADALNNKGKALLNLKKYGEAEQWLDRALKVDPRHKNALNNKGTLYRDGKQDYLEAIAWYNRALEIYPNFAAALYNKAKTFHELGRYQEALELVANTLKVEQKSQADQRLYQAAVRLNKILAEIIDRPPPDQLTLVDSVWRDVAKDKDFPGRQMYQFHVIIDGPITILDQIEFVNYRLPISWEQYGRAFQTVSDRRSQFKLKDLLWGSFTLYADVKFKGQDKLVTLSHRIERREQSPRLPV